MKSPTLILSSSLAQVGALNCLKSTKQAPRLFHDMGFEAEETADSVACDPWIRLHQSPDRWLTAWNPNYVTKGTAVRNFWSKSETSGQLGQLKSSVVGMAISASAANLQSGKSSNGNPEINFFLRNLDLIVLGADSLIRIRAIPIQQVCIVHLVLRSEAEMCCDGVSIDK